MVSPTTIARSGYYVLKMLPSVLLLPINTRARIGQMTHVFEEQLVQSGLDYDVSRQLAETYRQANRELVKQITSFRSWTRQKEAIH
jgi:hypothetical protein